MKKIITILAVLLMAAPAMADVTITATQVPDTNEVEIGYEVTGAELVRSFALDITVDNGAKITGIDDFFTGVCTSSDQGYGIFMSTITIDSSGDVTDPGNPVSPKSKLPADTQEGLGTGGITVGLASLYETVTPSIAPATSGKLFSIYLDVDESCELCINTNVSRGGIVLEDGTSSEDETPFTTTLPCITVEGNHDDCACYFDGNNDGKVNLTDYNILVGKLRYAKVVYGEMSLPSTDAQYNLCLDKDGDGDIDLSVDYNTLVGKLRMALVLNGSMEYSCDDVRF